MSEQFDYIIIGGGMAGGSAVEGIRKHDKNGSIAVFAAEKYPPYYRPALSKDLWSGKEKYDEIFVLGESFFKENKADWHSGFQISSVNPESKTITDTEGHDYQYGKLLIATGGQPRTLPNIPEGMVKYYRTVDDYKMLKEVSGKSDRFLIIGGGFIGAEIAASMSMIGKKVTIVFPEAYIIQRVLPEALALFVTDYYREKGVEVINNDTVDSFDISSGETIAKTKSGRLIVSDYVIAGLGINLNTELAESAGLNATRGGIIVDEYLRTSNPDIFAAGDIADFPAPAVDRRMRVEHWDNAQIQGRWAGENMAGANKPYDYLPYFYSDMFDLGFEAVGVLDSRFPTYAQWKEPYREGVVYYFENNLLRGVLLWNTWEKVEAARQLINQKTVYENIEDIRGKI